MSLGCGDTRGCSFLSIYYRSSHSYNVKTNVIITWNFSLRICPLFKCIKLMPAHITFPRLTSVSASVSGTFGELSDTTTGCISSVQTNCKVHQVQNTMSENVTYKILDQWGAHGIGPVNKWIHNYEDDGKIGSSWGNIERLKEVLWKMNEALKYQTSRIS